MANPQTRPFDKRIIILDFMPEGRSIGKPTGPLAQAMGETTFNFYELTLIPQTVFEEQQFVNLEESPAKGISKKRIINYDDLTDTAIGYLETSITAIIESNEAKYVDFFNRAMPITTRLHSLELLPGVGKKYLWDIIKQRKIRPFTSFEDLITRIKISDPKKSIIRRILLEMERQEKYYLFLPRPRVYDRDQRDANRRYDDSRRYNRDSPRRSY